MIWLEIFGYFGTALIFLSMMMTSVTKLRIVNMAGSFVSAIYAVICNTWPVVILNVGLIIINIVQLIRLYGHKTPAAEVEGNAENEASK